MTYAVRNDGQGYRAVLSVEDVGPDEHFSEAPPTRPEPSAVPAAVTMRQARLALLGAGKLDAVNAAVNGMAGAAGVAARIEWEFSSEVQRNKALVLALAPVLNLTDAQLDQLFITAATL